MSAITVSIKMRHKQSFIRQSVFKHWKQDTIKFLIHHSEIYWSNTHKMSKYICVMHTYVCAHVHILL
jgi:hypothetical protein